MTDDQPKHRVANMLDKYVEVPSPRPWSMTGNTPKRPDESVHNWLMESETQPTTATWDEFASWAYSRNRDRVRHSKWFSGRGVRFMAGVVAKEFTTEELDAMYAMWALEERGNE